MVRLKRGLSTTFIVIIVLLVCIRAVLPIWIKNYVNRTLDRVPEYSGSIGDVDLALIRGAYTIDDIKIEKTSGKVAVPFFSSPEVDFSIEWKALFQGKVVGEIVLEHPIINLVNGPSEATSQTKVDREWLQLVKDLFPFRMNRFEVNQGELHFRDLHRTPKVDVRLSNVEAVGTNFSNTTKPSEGLVARIKGTGLMEKHAKVRTDVQLAPAEKVPTFNLDTSLRGLKLTSLNDFLKAYGDVDAEDGDVSIDIEMASEKNKFRGYIKPLLHNVEVFRIKKDSDDPIQLVWEMLVGLVVEVFENQKHDQIATRIEYSGTFDDPKVSMWKTISNVLYNAFVKAFKEGIENTVNLSDSKKKSDKKK